MLALADLAKTTLLKWVSFDQKQKWSTELFTPAPSITQISLTNASTISKKEWLHGNKQE